MKYSPFFTRFLIFSNVILLAFISFVMVSGFGVKETPTKFKEIDAERINIIGTNGKPVLVISNRTHMPGPTMNGKSYPREVVDGRDYMSGMIFFNELGDEVGGLVYAGIKKSDSTYSAVVHLSFDQYRQNQVMALDYNDKNGNRYAGFRLWDRPTNKGFDGILDLIGNIKDAKNDAVRRDSLMKLWNEASARGDNGVERMFIGSKNEVAQIQLKDKKGNVRARLFVDNTTGDAKLEFLDAKGAVQSTFPK